MLCEVVQTGAPVLAANCAQWEEELARLVADADATNLEAGPTAPVLPQGQPRIKEEEGEWTSFVTEQDLASVATVSKSMRHVAALHVLHVKDAAGGLPGRPRAWVRSVMQF